MPPPMPLSGAPRPPSAPGNVPMPNFPTAPGGAAQGMGLHYGLQNLQNAANLSGQTSTYQAGQLGQQLQGQQGALQQSLMSRGLGNTSATTTMGQAPIQSYNQGMADLSNQAALRQMSAYGNLANMGFQGGNDITQTQQPYTQTQFTQNLMHGMAPQPQGAGPLSAFTPQHPGNPQQQQQQAAGGMAQQPFQAFMGAGQAGQLDPYTNLLQQAAGQEGGTPYGYMAGSDMTEPAAPPMIDPANYQQIG